MKSIAERFTETQNAGKHLDSLDTIRGIAILMVFSYHCLFWSHGTNKLLWDGWHRDLDQSLDLLLLIPVTWGHSGVAIFFVVSGFCIHLSHSRASRKLEAGSWKLEAGSWLQFFVRRICRIFPPYVVALALFTIGDVLTGQLTQGHEVYEQTWTHLLLVHNFGERTHFGINPSFWSIAVEAQLYWIYPLLWYVAKRKGWRTAMAVAFACEISIRFCNGMGWFPSGDLSRILTHGPLAYWFSWSMGAWIAERWMLGSRLPFSRLPIIGVATGFVACWLLQPLDAFFFPMASLTTATVLAKILEKNAETIPSTSGKNVISTSLAFVGTISYSFYLFHQPVISIWHKMMSQVIGHHHPLWLFLALLAAGVPITLLSWCSYRWIELPGIAFGKYFLNRIRLQSVMKNTPTNPK